MIVTAQTAPRADELVGALKASHGNLVLDDDGHWWALFRMRSVAYDWLAFPQKRRLFDVFENALGRLATRVKILSLVRYHDVDGYARGLKGMNADSPSFRSYCDEVRGKLEARAAYEREHYLAVRLKGSATPGAQWRLRAADGARALRRGIAGWVGSQDPAGASEGREEARPVADRVEVSLDDVVERPATEEDLAYLVLRGACGAPVRPRRYGAGRSAEPGGPDENRDAADGELRIPERSDPGAPGLTLEAARRRLARVERRATEDGLELRHEDGTVTYRRFLRVGKLPVHSLAFPGSEWAFLDLPVDLLLDFDVVPLRAAGRRAKPGSRLAEQDRRVLEAEADRNGGLQEAELADRELEAPYGTRPFGYRGAALARCRATIGVAARTPAELDERSEEAARFYSSIGVDLAVARRAQSEAWADFLPAGRRRVRDRGQRMSSRTISGGMPIGAEALGDGQGFYIGYLQSQPRSAVAYDPGLPLRRDAGGAACFVGERGAGTVFAASALAGLSVLAGHESTIVDSAGELGDMHRIPELAEGGVRVVEVGPGSPTRSPIMSVFGCETTKASKATEGLLRSFLLQLTEAQKDPDHSLVIRLGVRDFMRDDVLRRRGVGGLVEQFHRNGARPDLGQNLSEISKRAAEYLERWISSPLAGPVLQGGAVDADDAGLRGQEGEAQPLTVVRARGLPLPDRDAVLSGEGLSEEERVGQAVFSVFAASAMSGMTDRARPNGRGRFRSVVYAQAWRLSYSPEGQGLLNFLIRDARSRDVVPILCTERWRDLEPIVGVVPIRFMGRQGSDPEDAELGLRILGAEISPRTVSRVGSFKAGEFLHQDVFGRVCAMRFDGVPQGWMQYLAASPETSTTS